VRSGRGQKRGTSGERGETWRIGLGDGRVDEKLMVGATKKDRNGKRTAR